MNLSRPFIARPVATTLVTVGVLLAGILAFAKLPVAPLPQVEFPAISVTATLPGASPETMAATVAAPLERTLGKIAGVNEITSTSTVGKTQLVLQFDLGRSIDGAARDVQAGINAARTLLPSSMPNLPSYRKVNPADAPVMLLSLTSPTVGRGALYDFASTVLAQRLAQIPGVGQVSVGGGALPAVRIDLDPRRLSAAGVGLDDVRAAVVANHQTKPLGTVSSGVRRWQLQANDQLQNAAAFAPLIVRSRSGAALRLADVADVADGVEDSRNFGATDGQPSVLLLVYRQPGANIIETVDAIQAQLPQLRALAPPGVALDVTLDRTPSIRASLFEVERTLAIAVALVIMVVFLFLRRLRAALIPTVVVPVSLVGTFAVMYLCGYSLDNLSLMALTVATGFVVDDAIVVVENIVRHLDRGASPRDAALAGTREIGFTVVSISISLIAVFIPILLMGGIVGRLFREFAVTLSAAILVSMVVSLTTAPAMAAQLLQPVSAEPRSPGRWRLRAQRIVRRLYRGYRASLAWALRHRALMLAVLGATIALNVHLYATISKGFFPQQDTGRIIALVQADQSISFEALRDKMQTMMATVRRDPAVDHVAGFTGGGTRNSGLIFIVLKPLSQRRHSADGVIARLRKPLSQVAGASLYMVPVQDLRIGGRSSNAQYQYTLQADSLEDLRSWEPKIRRALAKVPVITDLNSDLQDHGLETMLTIDRDAVARLGLNVAAIDATLDDAFSQRQIATMLRDRNQYRVVMELAPPYQTGADALDTLFVTGPDGAQVPLSAFARIAPSNTALAINHQSGFPAATLSFNLPPGVALGDAAQQIDAAMAAIRTPTSIQGSFQGTAKAFQDSQSNQLLLIVAAIVAVYLVLGMLYENLLHPLTILSTLPSAGVGALLALMAFQTEFSVIALIGVVLLIGIVKKNAIIMIDFALDAQRRLKMTPAQAIYRAGVLRFRPILMTTVAAVFGALPLALGRGDGIELRQPLGIAIVGGLIGSQLLTLYTTPIVFVGLDALRQRLRRGRPAAPSTRAAATEPESE